MTRIAILLTALCAWNIACDYYFDNRQMASNADVNKFIADQLAEYEATKPMTKADALYEVWNIKEEDIAGPVFLFGEDGGRI